MRIASIVSMMLLLGITVCALADDTKVLGVSKICKTCSSKEQISEGDPKVMVVDVPGKRIVPKTCDAMREIGVKQVVGMCLMNEKVKTESRTFKYEGNVYEWKAIIYDGPEFPRYAARTLTKNGTPATRLEELKLVISGKIDLAVWGGHWLPPRNQGVCTEFGYGKLGKNSKVDVVATLPDGRIIKSITQDGMCDYFAVETVRNVKKPYSFTITMSPVSDCMAKKERWATLEELKQNGNLEKDVVSMKVIGSESYNDGTFTTSTRTYLIMGERATTEVQSTTYPFYTTDSF